MWRINQRIVKLMVELMRNHDSPEALIILSSASDLLLRATDGMPVDREACTLPQLELLEATASEVQLMLDWGESSSAVTDGLLNLLKCHLQFQISLKGCFLGSETPLQLPRRVFMRRLHLMRLIYKPLHMLWS